MTWHHHFLCVYLSSWIWSKRIKTHIDVSFEQGVFLTESSNVKWHFGDVAISVIFEWCRRRVEGKEGESQKRKVLLAIQRSHGYVPQHQRQAGAAVLLPPLQLPLYARPPFGGVEERGRAEDVRGGEDWTRILNLFFRESRLLIYLIIFDFIRDIWWFFTDSACLLCGFAGQWVHGEDAGSDGGLAADCIAGLRNPTWGKTLFLSIFMFWFDIPQCVFLSNYLDYSCLPGHGSSDDRFTQPSRRLCGGWRGPFPYPISDLDLYFLVSLFCIPYIFCFRSAVPVSTADTISASLPFLGICMKSLISASSPLAEMKCIFTIGSRKTAEWKRPLRRITRGITALFWSLPPAGAGNSFSLFSFFSSSSFRTIRPFHSSHFAHPLTNSSSHRPPFRLSLDYYKRLYEEFQGRIQILVVYIREAHAR